MNWLPGHKGLVSAALVALVTAGMMAGWLVWWTAPGAPVTARVVQTIASPATLRLDRDMSRVLDLLDEVERGVIQEGRPCERCSYLEQTVAAYREKAEAALVGIREAEASLSIVDDRAPPATKTTLERTLASRQKAAARAIAGLRSYTNALRDCETEQLCRRDDTVRAQEAQPLDCTRDAGPVRAAAARIAELSERVVAQARQCQVMACPIMSCDRSASFAADLAVAEMSLAELAGGRTALPGVVEEILPTGLAVVLGGVERALVRLSIDSAGASLAPEMLSARAEDMRNGLLAWVEETEIRKGVQKHTWRVGALMAEIDVAAEWARRDETEEYTRAYFEALSRAMLSAARLDAALAIADDQAEVRQGQAPAAGPVCGATELADAYLKVGRAIAALGFCQAKSACPQPSGRLGHRPLRSTDRSIGALAAVTGALPLGLERAADAGVRASSAVRLTLNRPTYQAGEAVRVSADTSPSACLASTGSIGIGRAGAREGREQRYTLAGNATSEILLAAPGEAGHYVIRVFASPDRGGHVLSEHPLNIQPMAPGCDGFTGTWDTEFGRLHLVDREGQVTGSYRRSANSPLPGLLIASRSKQVLEGTWLSELGRGGARLRLAADGQSFSGTWGVKTGRVTGGGRWTGICLGTDEAAQDPIP